MLHGFTMQFRCNMVSVLWWSPTKSPYLVPHIDSYQSCYYSQAFKDVDNM